VQADERSQEQLDEAVSLGLAEFAQADITAKVTRVRNCRKGAGRV
jgi:hypothetical protein